MSKTSSKSKYEQLLEWLPTLGRTQTSKRDKSQSKFSKGDYYKEKGAYGKNSN